MLAHVEHHEREREKTQCNYHLWSVRCNKSWTAPNTVMGNFLWPFMVLQTNSAVFFVRANKC